MKKKLTLLIVIFAVSAYFLIGLITEERDTRNYTIGVLMTGENRIEKLDGLKSGLEKLGYHLDLIEFVIKNGNDDTKQLQDVALDLLEQELDLIVTLGGIETQIMEQRMDEMQRYIPTVFVGIAAPFELGLIEEHKNPGSFFTGVNNFQMNLSAKRVEMFSDLLPSLERIFLLYSGGIEISEMSLHVAKEAAERIGISAIAVDLNRTGALKQLEAAVTERDGILTLPSYQIELLAEEIAMIGLKKRAPTMGIYDYEVVAGYMFSYGSTFFDQGYQAARHVSLILQGNEPSHLPVELPDSIKFIMNEEVRKQLQVDVNQDIRKLAEVYEVGSD